MYYERTIEKTLRNISDTFPVLLVTGPRQVGKTTILKKIASPERKFVSLGTPIMRSLAINDPELFLQRYSPPVAIDEVQYAPKLFDYIKDHVDRTKRNGDFWLTGSQTFHLMKGVTESLAGRVGVIRMQGLTNSEISHRSQPPFVLDPPELLKRMNEVPKMDVMQVFERIFLGSLPRLYDVDGLDRDTYFDSYLETYIQRDVKQLSQITNELSFINFIQIVAARTATNVQYEELANECRISATTANQWLSVLVSSGMVALIPPFSNNALKRVIKAPRMYFLDTGLCAYLTRWNSPATLETGAMNGRFFETWVVSEIYKSYLANGKRPPLFFYRDSNKKEIDLIISQDGFVNPIEINKSMDPKDAVKNFSVLKPIEKKPTDEDVFSGAAHFKTTIGTGAVISMVPDVIPIDEKNWSIPAWLI